MFCVSTCRTIFWMKRIWFSYHSIACVFSLISFIAYSSVDSS